MAEIMVILFFAVPIVGGALVLLWVFLREGNFLPVPASWPVTDGTVTSWWVEEVVLENFRPAPGFGPDTAILEDTQPAARSWTTRYWVIHVIYTYTVGSLTYSLESPVAGRHATREGAEQTASERFPTGGRVTLRYDPANPASSRLDEGAPLIEYNLGTSRLRRRDPFD